MRFDLWKGNAKTQEGGWIEFSSSLETLKSFLQFFWKTSFWYTVWQIVAKADSLKDTW